MMLLICDRRPEKAVKYLVENTNNTSMNIEGTFTLSSDGKTLTLNAEQYKNDTGSEHKSLICTFALEE